MKRIQRNLLKLSVRGQLLAMQAKKKLKTALQDDAGGTTAEHGSFAAGAVALVLVIFGLVMAFTKNTWMPKLEEKVLEIFNMS